MLASSSAKRTKHTVLPTVPVFLLNAPVWKAKRRQRIVSAKDFFIVVLVGLKKCHTHGTFRPCDVALYEIRNKLEGNLDGFAVDADDVQTLCCLDMSIGRVGMEAC